MIPDPKEFMRFLDGRIGDTLDVAYVPIEWGAHIGALTQNVKLKREYAHKIKSKHTLTYHEFGLIQDIITHGAVLQGRRKSLTFVLDPNLESGNLYKLVIKVTRRGHEMWILTFHRIRRSDFEKLKTKDAILRYQIA